MRPYPMSGNGNRSCDRLSVSHPAHRAGLDFCTESASCADSVSCSENKEPFLIMYTPWHTSPGSIFLLFMNRIVHSVPGLFFQNWINHF